MGDIFLGNLTALFIKSAPPGKHEDGHGLRLIKREDGGGQWVFRYTLYGRRREMGLGGLKALSLKDARDLASEYRTLDGSTDRLVFRVATIGITPLVSPCR